uniref:isoleucine--tRNA ligase n=2 Tax=Theileria parva TaxID=5875 RepID=Q4N5I0_THEPA|eukprot:XP_764876.1 isoleucyl-tRNA synthetase [Theileria parva strain Muguga]
MLCCYHYSLKKINSVVLKFKKSTLKLSCSKISNGLFLSNKGYITSKDKSIEMASLDEFHPTFDKVSDKVDFPKEEEKILKYWDDINVFNNCMKLSEGSPSFIFYDGPPFATGLPHYGHILAGSIKDVVTRYAYQTGHHVERRFGWDCHGLPIEHEIDNMYNIKHSSDVYKLGIDVYNEKCRSIVMKYSNEWKHIVSRTGRWIDFENDYKTLNTPYMETLWWIFKQLYQKNLVYRGFNVMPYSLSCNTPVSNFESNLNYKMVTDPSLFVSFKCLDEEFELVAWTTTPWTLPSNMALCVNGDFNYLKVKYKKNNKTYVVAECRLEYFCNALGANIDESFEKLGSLFGRELVGKKYEPLFDFFANHPNFSEELMSRAYVVVSDKMVTSESGTGIVHCAPYYGEDDYRVCMNYKILDGPLPELINESGIFVGSTGDLAGLYIKDADNVIKKMLKAKDQLVHSGTIVHSYPFCWRSDTPLIYKAVNCWFIKVSEFRQDILNSSMQTNWTPKFVRDKRFHNWVSEARDWCISRNRFWGTPIPLWTSEDYTQIVCIGSIEELENYTGEKVNDLHRHNVDHLLIPDPRGPEYPPLRRIPEIFDCWYESGSMPLAKIHYPFENKDSLDQHFPANFIAEGLDQTRGWFYTLMVLSTLLFNKSPFKNVIVNGLILASDGKKMSKRLKNYPDPLDIINQFGADSLRLFLISSPAVKAEPVRFSTDSVRNVLKDVILPWFHSYRFLVQEVTRYEVTHKMKFVPDPEAPFKSSCVMDRWINTITQELIYSVHHEMENYKLYNVMPKLLSFLEQLTNWYIRINRERMRGTFGDEECVVSLQSLFTSLKTFNHLMSMFAPFTSEMIYLNLRRFSGGMESIHYEKLPKSTMSFDKELMRRIEVMQSIILLSRTIRERKKISLKFPLRKLTVIHQDVELLSSMEELLQLIKDEINVLDVVLSTDTSLITLNAMPNFRILGARVGKDMKHVSDAVRNLDESQIKLLEREPLLLLGHSISIDDVVITRKINPEKLDNNNFDAESDNNLTVILELTKDDTLEYKALTREVANRVQKMRKELGLSIDDDITVYIYTDDLELFNMLESQTESLKKILKKNAVVTNNLNVANKFHSEEFSIRNCKVEVVIVKN